jgi:uncharacterized protein YjbJ (UPF0337 family)
MVGESGKKIVREKPQSIVVECPTAPCTRQSDLKFSALNCREPTTERTGCSKRSGSKPLQPGQVHATVSVFDRVQTEGTCLSKLRHDGAAGRQLCGLPVPAVARRSLAGMSCEEYLMGINKDQVKGHVEEAKGAIKEAAGKLVGNPSLEVKGQMEKNLGKAQANLGDAKEGLKKASKLIQ